MTENRSPNDYVPDDVQAVLIQLGAGTTQASFRVGDIANTLYMGHLREGKPAPAAMIHWAVGVYYGKGPETIRKYAEVAAFYDDQERTKYGALSFSHFATAKRLGAKTYEALDYAADNPGFTAAKMRKKFCGYDSSGDSLVDQVYFTTPDENDLPTTPTPAQNIPWLNILNRVRADLERLDVLAMSDDTPGLIRADLEHATDRMRKVLDDVTWHLTKRAAA